MSIEIFFLPSENYLLDARRGEGGWARAWQMEEKAALLYGDFLAAHMGAAFLTSDVVSYAAGWGMIIVLGRAIYINDWPSTTLATQVAQQAHASCGYRRFLHTPAATMAWVHVLRIMKSFHKSVALGPTKMNFAHDWSDQLTLIGNYDLQQALPPIQAYFALRMSRDLGIDVRLKLTVPALEILDAVPHDSDLCLEDAEDHKRLIERLLGCYVPRTRRCLVAELAVPLSVNAFFISHFLALSPDASSPRPI